MTCPSISSANVRLRPKIGSHLVENDPDPAPGILGEIERPEGLDHSPIAGGVGVAEVRARHRADESPRRCHDNFPRREVNFNGRTGELVVAVRNGIGDHFSQCPDRETLQFMTLQPDDD